MQLADYRVIHCVSRAGDEIVLNTIRGDSSRSAQSLADLIIFFIHESQHTCRLIMHVHSFLIINKSSNNRLKFAPKCKGTCCRRWEIFFSFGWRQLARFSHQVGVDKFEGSSTLWHIPNGFKTQFFSVGTISEDKAAEVLDMPASLSPKFPNRIHPTARN